MRSHFSGTIWFALACGIVFIPAFLGLGLFTGGYLAFRLVVWGFLAAYALMLCRWSQTRVFSCLFPLALLLAMVFAGLPQSAFLVAGVVILAWIRSGICFAKGGFRALALELGVSAGGALLVNVLAPHSQITWALAVWLFFLVQSIFFVLGPDRQASWTEIDAPGRFEQARQKAERILAGE